MPRQTSCTTDTAAGFDAAWQRLHAETAGEQEPPQGSITVRRYSDLNKISVARAMCELRRKAALGQLKTGIFRTSVNGKVIEIRHYWP